MNIKLFLERKLFTANNKIYWEQLQIPQVLKTNDEEPIRIKIRKYCHFIHNFSRIIFFFKIDGRKIFVLLLYISNNFISL